VEIHVRRIGRCAITVVLKMTDQPKDRRVLDGYLNESELAAEIGRSIVTLRLWRRKGDGPPFTRIKRTAYYSVEKVRRWIDAQERRQPKATA
jgi:hypothetical protein